MHVNLHLTKSMKCEDHEHSLMYTQCHSGAMILPQLKQIRSDLTLCAVYCPETFWSPTRTISGEKAIFMTEFQKHKLNQLLLCVKYLVSGIQL